MSLEKTTGYLMNSATREAVRKAEEHYYGKINAETPLVTAVANIIKRNYFGRKR